MTLPLPSEPISVASVAVLCFYDLSLVLFDFRGSRLHHLHVDDVVTAVHAVGFMSADEHPDLFRDTLPRHIANATPAQIVEVTPGQAV